MIDDCTESVAVKGMTSCCRLPRSTWSRIAGSPQAWVLTIGLALLFGCSDPSIQSEDELEKRQLSVLRQLAAETSASYDWDQELQPDGEPGLDDMRFLLNEPPKFSLDVRRAVVRDKPIAFLAELTDMDEDDGTYSLVFDHPKWGPAIVFVLTATPQQIEDILNNRPSDLDSYAVVAKVRDVERILMDVSAKPINERDAELDFSTHATPFRATGECVAYKLIPYDLKGSEE